MAAPTGETSIYASKDKTAQIRVKVGLDYPALPAIKEADFSTALGAADFAFSWLTAAPSVASSKALIQMKGTPPFEWIRTREHWFPADYNTPFKLTIGVEFPATDPIYTPFFIVGGIENNLADLDEPLIVYQQGSAMEDAVGGSVDPANNGEVRTISGFGEQDFTSGYTPGTEIVYEVEWDPNLTTNAAKLTIKQDTVSIYSTSSALLAHRPEYVQFGWSWGTEVARVSDTQLTARSRSYANGDAIPASGTEASPTVLMRITQLSVEALGTEPYEARDYPAWIRRNNLISNGHFNSATTGWAAVGSATPTRDTAIRREGTGGLKVVTTGGGANEGAGQSASVTVDASTQYTISCFFRQEASGSVIIRAAEYSAADSLLTSQSSSAIDLTAATGNDGWTHQTFTFTTGASTAGVRVQLLTSGTAAITFYADEVMLELGDTATLSEADGETWAILPPKLVSSLQVRRTRIGMGDTFSMSLIDDTTTGFDTQRWNERPILIDTKVGAATWKRQIAAYALSHQVSRTADSQSIEVAGRSIATYRLDTFLSRMYYGEDAVGTEIDGVNYGYDLNGIWNDLLDVAEAMHGSPLGALATDIQAMGIIPASIGTGGQSLLSTFTSLFDQVGYEYWMRYATSSTERYGAVVANAWDLGSGTADHTFALEEVFGYDLTEDVEAGPGQVSYRANLLVTDLLGLYSFWNIPTSATFPSAPYPAKAPVLSDSLSFARPTQATALQNLIDEDGSNVNGGVAQHRWRLEVAARRALRFRVVAQDWLEPSDEIAITNGPGQLSGETWVVDTIDMTYRAEEFVSQVQCRTSDWYNAARRGA